MRLKEQRLQQQRELARLRFAVYAMAAVLELREEENLSTEVAEHHRAWLIAKESMMDLTPSEAGYLARLQSAFEAREAEAVAPALETVNELRRQFGLPDVQ